jgi:hypothetical protein
MQQQRGEADKAEKAAAHDAPGGVAAEATEGPGEEAEQGEAEAGLELKHQVDGSQGRRPPLRMGSGA